MRKQEVSYLTNAYLYVTTIPLTNIQVNRRDWNIHISIYLLQQSIDLIYLIILMYVTYFVWRNDVYSIENDNILTILLKQTNKLLCICKHKWNKHLMVVPYCILTHNCTFFRGNALLGDLLFAADHRKQLKAANNRLPRSP